MDIGGRGRFPAPNLTDNFYTESESNSAGALDSGTMRYRPPFQAVGEEKNRLYHPVKPLSLAISEKIGSQKRQRGLLGRVALRILATFLPHRDRNR
jgi:hypothetical protein